MIFLILLVLAVMVWGGYEMWVVSGLNNDEEDL